MALANKSNIKIKAGSTTIEFTPKSLSPQYESLASPDSGRVDSGEMVIVEWLQRKLVKLQVELPPFIIGDTRYSSILNMVQGQEFQCTFYDLLSNTEKTINAYTSNSSGNWYSGIISDGIVQGITFNIIAKSSL